MPSEKYANSAASTLNGAITDVAVTLTVQSAAGFPSAPQFRIRVENEEMLVTAVAGAVFTVTRGIEGTVAAAHASAVAVTHNLTKEALDQIIADNCMYGTCAARPAAEKAGRMYYGSDYPMVYRDNGTTWDAFYAGKKVVPPVTSGYTWSHGAGTATNTDITNGPSLLKVTSVGAGDRISKFERNLAATPVNFTCRVAPQVYGSISFCGIYMGDGTKMAAFGFILETALTKMFLNKWNNLVSYGGEYYRVDFSGNSGDVWLRMRDDGTNRICSFSNDGVNFQVVHAIVRTDFVTATKCGLLVGTNQAAGLEVAMNWLSEE